MSKNFFITPIHIIVKDRTKRIISMDPSVYANMPIDFLGFRIISIDRRYSEIITLRKKTILLTKKSYP